MTDKERAKEGAEVLGKYLGTAKAPKFSRQTYRMVAEVLCTEPKSHQMRNVIMRFSEAFADDSPKFDPLIFWRACGMDEGQQLNPDTALTQTFRAQQEL